MSVKKTDKLKITGDGYFTESLKEFVEGLDEYLKRRSHTYEITTVKQGGKVVGIKLSADIRI